MRVQDKSKDELIRDLLELRAENDKLKKIDKELSLKNEKAAKLLVHQSERFALLHKFSIELDNQTDKKTSHFIVEKFKSFFNVKEVAISTYNEIKSEMVVTATTLSERNHSKVAQFLGANIIGKKTIIDQIHYKMMVERGICDPSTLHDVSFGQVPEAVSSTINKLFGIGWFQAISLTDEGKLYGGLIIAGYKGQEKLNKDELLVFIEITSNILRRKKIGKELVTSERRFRELSDLLPQIIFEADLQWNITFTNQFGLKLMGYSPEDLQNGLNLLNLIAPADRLLIMTRLKEIISGSDTNPKEINLIRKSGEILPIIIHASLILENGRPKGLRGIGVDITDRKRIETEIKSKNEQLQKINAEKDKFFSILAHDLRGPFTNFLGFTQLMTDGLNSMTYQEIETIAESMRTSANNLYNLLENLLKWSEMQRGRILFDPTRFNLLKEITNCIELITGAAQKKEINIDIAVPEELEIMADIHMFDTVIRNLVSNAIKFTHHGGSIIISASSSTDNYVDIGIEDTGIGMNEEFQDKLFKINEVTSREGTEGEPSTGLGLLLCKDFIEKHRGKIYVSSQEGKGSTFIFTMPKPS